MTAADVATGAVANSATAHGTDPDGDAVARPANAATATATNPDGGLVVVAANRPGAGRRANPQPGLGGPQQGLAH